MKKEGRAWPEDSIIFCTCSHEYAAVLEMGMRAEELRTAGLGCWKVDEVYRRELLLRWWWWSVVNMVGESCSQHLKRHAMSSKNNTNDEDDDEMKKMMVVAITDSSVTRAESPALYTIRKLLHVIAC